MKYALLIAAVLVSGCAQYQAYDRSHDRQITVSYDDDDHTMEFGYSITPVNPVKGYAK